MDDNEKEQAEEFRHTPDGIRLTIRRLKERESKLMLELVLREHPELEKDVLKIASLLANIETTRLEVLNLIDAEGKYNIALKELDTHIDNNRDLFAAVGANIDEIVSQLT